MVDQGVLSIFANAAAPQKVVLIILVGAIPVIFLAAALALRAPSLDSPWRRLISTLRTAGPALGLLVGAMNSFHMAQTIQRLPFDATAKQLAPGILEISTLIGLGATVGLIAGASHIALSWAAARKPAS
jgi:hypothetical protein